MAVPEVSGLLMEILPFRPASSAKALKWRAPPPGCISAGYYSLYHNPAKYAGANIAVEGTIKEIRPGQDGSVDVFLEMEGDFLGLTKGILCATYTSTLHGQLPPEGVPVTIYGMFKDVSARMMDGSSMSMPVMNAEYVVRH